MNLIKKINGVKKVLSQADRHVARFQVHANIHCLFKCGTCCTKNDIQTTILEFLPAAHELFLKDEYQVILDKLENQTDTSCIFYNPFLEIGFCSGYTYRGLICRLFGFSVNTAKNGIPFLTTCKYIKQTTDLKSLQEHLIHAPDMTDYYLRLYGLDPKLSVQYFPINESIKKALDIVLFHFQYTKKPA